MYEGGFMKESLFKDWLMKERKTLSDIILVKEPNQYLFYSGKKKMLDDILIKLAEGDFEE